MAAFTCDLDVCRDTSWIGSGRPEGRCRRKKKKKEKKNVQITVRKKDERKRGGGGRGDGDLKTWLERVFLGNW